MDSIFAIVQHGVMALSMPLEERLAFHSGREEGRADAGYGRWRGDEGMPKIDLTYEQVLEAVTQLGADEQEQ